MDHAAKSRYSLTYVALARALAFYRATGRHLSSSSDRARRIGLTMVLGFDTIVDHWQRERESDVPTSNHKYRTIYSTPTLRYMFWLWFLVFQVLVYCMTFWIEASSWKEPTLPKQNSMNTRSWTMFEIFVHIYIAWKDGHFAHRSIWNEFLRWHRLVKSLILHSQFN